VRGTAKPPQMMREINTGALVIAMTHRSETA
jgi:hypothetical protein